MSEIQLFKVDDGILKKVAKELGYSSLDLLNKDVFKIKEWIKTQPQLPEIMDDKLVQNFLILNKGNVEKAKGKIENYYSMRERLPDLFEESNPNLDHYQEVYKYAYFVPHPKLTKDMCRVFCHKMRVCQLPDDLNLLVRHLVNIQELRLSEDVAYGDIFIFDGENIPFSIIFHITPALIYRTLVIIYKQVFSNRLKGVYVLNPPPFTEKVLYLFKTILNPKILQRIHLCQKPEDLFDVFGKDFVPEDYGGDGYSLTQLQEALQLKFKQNRQRFDKLDTFVPKDLKQDDSFGCSGSFRKLELD